GGAQVGGQNTGSNDPGGAINGRLGDQNPAETSTTTQHTSSSTGNSVVDLSNPSQGIEVNQFGLSIAQAELDVEGARQFLRDAVPGSPEEAVGNKNMEIAEMNLQRAGQSNASANEQN